MQFISRYKLSNSIPLGFGSVALESGTSTAFCLIFGYYSTNQRQKEGTPIFLKKVTFRLLAHQVTSELKRRRVWDIWNDIGVPLYLKQRKYILENWRIFIQTLANFRERQQTSLQSRNISRKTKSLFTPIFLIVFQRSRCPSLVNQNDPFHFVDLVYNLTSTKYICDNFRYIIYVWWRIRCFLTGVYIIF